eukprot:scaffold926_cov408-Prasinococcus_capsulatus_cf.AAC.43
MICFVVLTWLHRQIFQKEFPFFGKIKPSTMAVDDVSQIDLRNFVYAGMQIEVEGTSVRFNDFIVWLSRKPLWQVGQRSPRAQQAREMMRLELSS